MGQKTRYEKLGVQGKSLMLELLKKRVTVFMGHYGSGKTFVAVNYAKFVKSQNKDVAIYDLDIVNPYFRTVDAEKELKECGVELIVSPYAETNVDIPAMNPASYKMVDDLSTYAVVDIGGDDRGALALGRFRDKLISENSYSSLLVVNKFRPETSDIESVLEMKKEIEISGKLPFTGIVNNSNLGIETTERAVLEGYEFCKKVSEKTGLPLVFTSVRVDLVDKIKNKVNAVLPVVPINYKQW